MIERFWAANRVNNDTVGRLWDIDIRSHGGVMTMTSLYFTLLGFFETQPQLCTEHPDVGEYADWNSEVIRDHERKHHLSTLDTSFES